MTRMGQNPGSIPPSEHQAEPIPGADSFSAPATAYDLFMGRYSLPLARAMVDRARLTKGSRVLDVGCGPGAMTQALLAELDRQRVWACDPSPEFVNECARLNPTAHVQQGRAEALPYADRSFDRLFCTLVLHFVSDPQLALTEMVRVLVPGGGLSLSAWASEDGPQMLSAFTAAVNDTAGPEVVRTAGLEVLRFGGRGELSAQLEAVGCQSVVEEQVTVTSHYQDFEELWAGLLLGIGPPGAYVANLGEAQREELRHALFLKVGSPSGAFTLSAGARVAEALTPA